MLSQDKTTAIVTGAAGVLVFLASVAWWQRSSAAKAAKLSPPPSPDQTVLVIGAGIAGLSCIHALRQLDSDVKIVVVDPRQYAEILWAACRSPFEDWVAKGSLIRLKKYFAAYTVQHIQATVTRLDPQEAILGNGQKVRFDVCCVATGATADWHGMGRTLPSSKKEATPEHRLAAMKAEGERLLKADSVVIIGGGLIGTELAGDIAGYAARQKKQAAASSSGTTTSSSITTPQVTLIHSGPQLCPVMSLAAATTVQRKLQALGVKIILNEKAAEKEIGSDNNSKKVVVQLQNSGQELETDIVIKTIGFQPVNGFMKPTFAAALDAKGWITTDQHLVVAGSNNNTVFAYGDCSPSLPDAANIYMRVAPVLAHNIKVALWNNGKGGGDNNNDKDKSPYEMKPFTVPFAGYCNTVGPDDGVFYSSAFWTTRLLPWVKNRTMFFMSPRDTIGVQQEYTLAADNENDNDS